MPLIVLAGCSFTPLEFCYIKESMVLEEEPIPSNMWTSVGNAFMAKSGCTFSGMECLTSNASHCTCAL